MKRAFLVLGLLLAALAARAQTLTVLAAASLRETFTEIAHQFEAAHPDVTVRLSFGGSQQLVASILLDAPADVFASADPIQMKRAVTGGKVNAADVKRLCGNRLVVVYNAKRTDFHTLGDLGKTGVRVALAKKSVPVGEYSEHVLDGLVPKLGAAMVGRIRANVVVRDDDVRAVLLHVSLGEADAGIVYATDVAAAGDKVKSIPIAAALQPKVDYEIAAIKASAQSDLAREFVKLATGRVGRRALAKRGFDVAAARLRASFISPARENVGAMIDHSLAYQRKGLCEPEHPPDNAPRCFPSAGPNGLLSARGLAEVPPPARSSLRRGTGRVEGRIGNLELIAVGFDTAPARR